MIPENMDKPLSFKYIRRIQGEFKARDITLPMILLFNVEDTYEGMSKDESQWGFKNKNSKAEFKEAFLLDESLNESLLKENNPK